MEAEPVALPAEWHGTVLVVPDDDLRGQVLRRSALSVSTAQNISGCQARFALEKLYQHTGEIPPDDLFAPNVIGNLAHEVLENLYRAEPGDRSEELAEDISTEVVAQAIRRNHLAAQVSFTELLLAEVRDAYRGVFRLENPADVHVATVPVNGEDVPGLELQLSGVQIAGVPLIGFVDRARAIDGDDSRISIEDYKSGSGKRKREKDRYFSHGDQLRIYALGFAALTGITPEEARIIYSRHSRSRIMDAPVTLAPKALDKTASWFASTWETHLGLADTGLYETSDGPLCGWCPFVRICPTARENGREAKAGQPEGVLADLPALPRLVPAGDGPAEPGAPRTTSQDDQEESIMSGTSKLFGKELKVWEDAPDGALPNPNGYAAMGAFGLVGLAVEELHKAGVPLSPSKVTALSETFAVVVRHVQKETAGSTDLGAGANTRMRGALRTALETLPVPFEQDAEAWDAWAEGLARRTKSIAVVAAHLLEGSYSDKPWRALATEARVKAA